MLGRKKRRSEQPLNTADDTYRGLRGMALDAVARGLVPLGPGHPDVSGLVVDVPGKGGFATVVALTDNTTSMYTSTGGGTIGAGAHAEVAAATQGLLDEVQRNLGLFKAKDDHLLPATGFVRFHVLTPSVGRCADVPENAFWGREPHEMMPVIAATQEVISAIQAASPA